MVGAAVVVEAVVIAAERLGGEIDVTAAGSDDAGGPELVRSVQPTSTSIPTATTDVVTLGWIDRSTPQSDTHGRGGGGAGVTWVRCLP